MARTGAGILGVHGIKSGNLYHSTGNIEDQTTTFTATANTIYAFPILIEETVSITEIGTKRVNAPDTGCVAGIYSAGNNRLPKTLIVDGGVVDMSANSETTVTVASTELTPGLYYIVFSIEGAAALHRTNDINYAFITSLCLPNDSPEAMAIGYNASYTYIGSLPAAFPTSLTAMNITGDTFFAFIKP